MSSDIGEWCTDDSTVQRFFAETFDESTSQFNFSRESSLWDAVQSAHAAGKRGGGRVVAVVDTMFDLCIGRLANAGTVVDRQPPAPTDRRGHGSAVALLINEVAPEARLVLHDVQPGQYLHKSEILEALGSELASAPDAINMSLGFPSDAARAAPGLNVDILFDVSATKEALAVAVLEKAEAWKGPFAGGCIADCVLCDALNGMAAGVVAVDGVAVVAAGGNDYASSCPAAHERCIGIAFMNEQRVVGTDSDIASWRLPQQAQNLLSDFFLPAPPGFRATSFAAPLLSGVVALDGSGADLAGLLGSAFAHSQLAIRHDYVLPTATNQAAVAEDLLALYAWVWDHLPTDHRHGVDAQACATCGLLLTDLYVRAGKIAGELGRFDEALGWIETGMAINALSVDVLMTRGAILRYRSRSDASPDAVADRRAASDSYAAAAARRRGDTAHQALVAAILKEIEADGQAQ